MSVRVRHVGRGRRWPSSAPMDFGLALTPPWAHASRVEPATGWGTQVRHNIHQLRRNPASHHGRDSGGTRVPPSPRQEPTREGAPLSLDWTGHPARYHAPALAATMPYAFASPASRYRSSARRSTPSATSVAAGGALDEGHGHQTVAITGSGRQPARRPHAGEPPLQPRSHGHGGSSPDCPG